VVVVVQRPGVQRAAGWIILVDRKLLFLLLDAKIALIQPLGCNAMLDGGLQLYVLVPTRRAYPSPKTIPANCRQTSLMSVRS
jgi:hypothetical protein